MSELLRDPRRTLDAFFPVDSSILLSPTTWRANRTANPNELLSAQAGHGFLGSNQSFHEHLVTIGLFGLSEQFHRTNQMVFSLLEMLCKLMIWGLGGGFLGKSWQMTLFSP